MAPGEMPKRLPSTRGRIGTWSFRRVWRRSGESAARGEDDDFPGAGSLESTGGPAGGGAGGDDVVDQEHDAVLHRGGLAAGEVDAGVHQSLTAAAADLRSSQRASPKRGRQRSSETTRKWPGDRLGVVAAAGESAAPVHRHGHDNLGATQVDSQARAGFLGDVVSQVVESAVLQAEDDLVERRSVGPQPEERVTTFEPVFRAGVPGRRFEQSPARPAQPEFPLGVGRAGEAGPRQEQAEREGRRAHRQPTAPAQRSSHRRQGGSRVRQLTNRRTLCPADP